MFIGYLNMVADDELPPGAVTVAAEDEDGNQGMLTLLPPADAASSHGDTEDEEASSHASGASDTAGSIAEEEEEEASSHASGASDTAGSIAEEEEEEDAIGTSDTAGSIAEEDDDVNDCKSYPIVKEGYEEHGLVPPSSENMVLKKEIRRKLGDARHLHGLLQIKFQMARDAERRAERSIERAEQRAATAESLKNQAEVQSQLFMHECQHQISRNSQIMDDLIKARTELAQLKEHCRMVKDMAPRLAEEGQREYLEQCEKDIEDDTASRRIGKVKSQAPVQLPEVRTDFSKVYKALFENGYSGRGGSKRAVKSDDEEARRRDIDGMQSSGDDDDEVAADAVHVDRTVEEPSSSRDIQVFIKTLSGKTIWVFMPPTATIAVFKQAVERKTHVPTQLQRIYFSGTQLIDGTLASNNVQHESTVHLGGPIGGGGKRARVALAEIRQRDDDPPLIKAVFAVTEFEVQSFLQAMTSDEVAAYYDLLKQYRSIDRQIAITVAEIPAMKALEDLRFYLVYKGTG
jgi:hypothetical protein